MINFLGKLCHLLSEESPTKVCPVRAAEMLLDHFDHNGVFVSYRKGKARRWWLESTVECERQHKVKIKVPLPGKPLDPVFWSL
jgi:hypothetical protein